jgi:hypothetical protein
MRARRCAQRIRAGRDRSASGSEGDDPDLANEETGWGWAGEPTESGSFGSGLPRAVTWLRRRALGARTPW